MAGALSWTGLALAGLPLGLMLDNLRRFRRPALAAGRPALSVLIPARNEAANIGDAVAAVLASEGVDVELIVLDDGSTDATPQILAGIGDPRLRVAAGGTLPAGWSGKQHACAALARLASRPLLVFVDADVRLAPDALSRMAGFMGTHDVGLASGFPRQVTRSWSEVLLLPLIHFLLLGYLPLVQMQRSGSTGLGAGCGQLFIARADAYAAAGGHAAIRASLHDGLMLPRAFRRAGFMTGLFDATSCATCRMYSNAAQVWEGLTKNATEGMAKPSRVAGLDCDPGGWRSAAGGDAAGRTVGGQRHRLCVLAAVPPDPGGALPAACDQCGAASFGYGVSAGGAVGGVAAGGFRAAGDMAGARLHGAGVMRKAGSKRFFFEKKTQKGVHWLWRGFGICLVFAAMSARAATVEVTVDGVRGTRGDVLVALCSRAEFLRPHCAWRGHAPAHPGSVVVTIADVPPGLYAAQAFHDENGNGRLDRNILGLPKEAMGFSNDAVMHMGPPRFDAAAFQVAGDVAHIAFKLHYY